MKLIKPKSISGEIMELIEEADDKLIIVSPYCDFKNWQKIINTFEVALKKEIDIEFYIRDDQPKSLEQVRDLGIEPILIRNLHTKLYINEHTAIVSSMNLLYSSDSNSLDIAYKTETEKEYKELIDYYERYLRGNVNRTVSKFEEHDGDMYNYILDKLSQQLLLGVGIDFEEPNSFTLKTRNRYNFFITEGNRRCLRISGIFSYSEFQYAIKLDEKKILENEWVEKIELVEGKPGYYNMIWGEAGKNLKSKSLDNVLNGEQELIADAIVEFVLLVEGIKQKHRDSQGWK